MEHDIGFHKIEHSPATRESFSGMIDFSPPLSPDQIQHIRDQDEIFRARGIAESRTIIHREQHRPHILGSIARPTEGGPVRRIYQFFKDIAFMVREAIPEIGMFTKPSHEFPEEPSSF